MALALRFVGRRHALGFLALGFVDDFLAVLERVVPAVVLGNFALCLAGVFRRTRDVFESVDRAFSRDAGRGRAPR